MKKPAIFLNFYNRVNGKTGSHSQKNKYCPPSSAGRACNAIGILNSSPIYVIIRQIRNERGIAMKKKIQEHYRIISLDGSDVYKLSHPSHMYGKLTAMKDGEIDYSKFNATLDVSLDTQKLAEIYPKHASKMGVPFVEELEFTRAIINLSFDYAVKLFEQSGNRFIRFGYSVEDGDFRDHICIREIDGVPTLIAVELPHYSVSEYAPVENPVDASVLGKRSEERRVGKECYS